MALLLEHVYTYIPVYTIVFVEPFCENVTLVSAFLNEYERDFHFLKMGNKTLRMHDDDLEIFHRDVKESLVTCGYFHNERYYLDNL
jgi:hypothetical protein